MQRYTYLYADIFEYSYMCIYVYIYTYRCAILVHAQAFILLSQSNFSSECRHLHRVTTMCSLVSFCP